MSRGAGFGDACAFTPEPKARVSKGGPASPRSSAEIRAGSGTVRDGIDFTPVDRGTDYWTPEGGRVEGRTPVEAGRIPTGASSRSGGGRMGQREIARRRREQLQEGYRRSANRQETTLARREDAAARRAAEREAVLAEPLTPQERQMRDSMVDAELQVLERERLQRASAYGPDASNRDVIAALKAAGMEPSLQDIQDAVEARIRMRRLPDAPMEVGGIEVKPLSKRDARAAQGTASDKLDEVVPGAKENIVAGAPLATPVQVTRDMDRVMQARAEARAEHFDAIEGGYASRPETVEDPVTGRRVVAGENAARLRAIAARYSPRTRMPDPARRRNPGATGRPRKGQAHLDEQGNIIPATPSREKPWAGRDKLDADQTDMETVNPPSPDLGGLPRGISAETRDLPSTYSGGDPTLDAIDTAVNGPRLQDVERRPRRDDT